MSERIRISGDVSPSSSPPLSLPLSWRLARRVALDDERSLAGLLSGVLYLTGAVSAPLMLTLPGAPMPHWRIVLALAAAGAIWGIACLTVLRWETAASYVTHLSSCAGFVVAGTLVAATGGASSPARLYLFFIAVYAAYFYSPRVAFAYLLGCGAVHALPLLYDHQAVAHGFLRELLVAIPSYLVLGGGIVAGKRLLERLRLDAERAGAEQRRLAAEQGALRRVATSVAAGHDPETVYRLVSREVAMLLAASASGLVRFKSSREAIVVGAWSREGKRTYPCGTVVPVRTDSDLAEVLATGRPVRVDEHLPGSPVDLLGYRCSIVAPVRVGERTWGALAIVSEVAAGLRRGTEERLLDFSELLATAIANTEAQGMLAEQATSDPLTGLVNHRTFHERMRVEVARAQRHGGQLSLAIIDVDHFKEANDSLGHELGDRILAELSERLLSVARAEDTVARIGGDEFALLLPLTDRMQAFTAVDRLRRLVAEEPMESRRVTVSAGICDLEHAGDAETLFRLADGALYWSKAHGRDSSWIYDPEVVQELSAQERADHLQRSQALTGLRALARAIDARDPTTRRHSERVAALATLLAEQVGWAPERAALLREAAMIHDVGKIGVADAVLLKPGPLTDDEYLQVKQHAALSAQIAEEVLRPEQVSWIRSHHERPDGCGYPDGLLEDRISDGAALLAVADSWDVMTISRPYSLPKTTEVALEECRRLVGRQFAEQAVEALEVLARSGGLAQLAAVPPTFSG